jgi:hypothetical protein
MPRPDSDGYTPIAKKAIKKETKKESVKKSVKHL